ncbi:translocase [Rhodobacteraceae bacterium D3-12]|nr:translocase [Rhodobacteraceae bacterium D3-12]
MADVKRYATAGGTLACILAIGFFMQSGANAPKQEPVAINGMGMQPAGGGLALSEIALTAGEAERVTGAPVITVTDVAPKAAEPAATPVAATAPKADAGAQGDASIKDRVIGWIDRDGKTPQPTLAQAAPVSEPKVAQTTGEKPVELSLLSPNTPTDTIVVPREEPKMAANCEITMTAQPMAAALVKVALSAPCLPNERLTMHHSGLVFTDTTDADGKYEMAVPALAQNAVFIASFANGDGAVANAAVPELKDFDRAVVQSEFRAGAALHALEFGADYYADGHIWAASTGEIADAAVGQGGFMILLGNPVVANALTAQVYTYPSGLTEKSGDVSLSVEIEVTAENCGKPITAETLQTVRGEASKVQKLDLTMPDCDAIGDFLVLKKLVNDLKVAAATN